MDSLTQIALGGAVAYAVMGHSDTSPLGRKAILWGAALGTLPDLDVFLPYSGEVEAFTYHRGFSHSILMHLLVSPLIAWLIMKIHHPAQAIRDIPDKMRYVAMVFLCLSTHAVLDSFTVYGTQLMWPLSEYPVGVSNLFIIDPLYTLPLLICLLIAAIPKIRPASAQRINVIGLCLSSVYLLWSFSAKVMIDHKLELALSERDIDAKAYVSTPAPFNTLLWRIVIIPEDNTTQEYYEGYASVFDKPEEVSFYAHPNFPSLLNGIENEWGVARLKWFTKGLYSVRQTKQNIVLSDLRMGVECSYVFNFVVGKHDGNQVIPGDFSKISQRPDFSQVGAIWDRIFDPSVSLAPKPC